MLSCYFKWNPPGQTHKLPGWTLNREWWWLWFLWIYACYVSAGAETQTAVMMFGWNEAHQTYGSIRTDWAFMLKCEACQGMMPMMSAARPRCCHKVPCHKPSGDPAANTVLSTLFHTLEMSFSPSNSRERNKQIECKCTGKKSKGENRRNDMGIGFMELFSKAGLRLSNAVLTSHTFKWNGSGKVAEINYAMLNLLLSRGPLRGPVMFT